MTDEIATQKARELAAAEVEDPHWAQEYLKGRYDSHYAMIALRKHLREVSNVMEQTTNKLNSIDHEYPTVALEGVWKRFILHKPKPDPLVKAILSVGVWDTDKNRDANTLAREIRAALAAQGIKLEGEG